MNHRQTRRLGGALLLIAALTLAGLAQARPWWLRGTTAKEADFLPPDVAFRVAAYVDGNRLQVRWVIADGYYLYRDKIAVEPESPDLLVDRPVLPPGKSISDPYFGAQTVYFQHVEAAVAYRRSDYGAHPLQIKVTYQGCAEAGLCYPPISKVIFPIVAQGLPDATAHLAAPWHAWELLAIGGGFVAFLIAGLARRRDKRLPMPAP